MKNYLRAFLIAVAACGTISCISTPVAPPPGFSLYANDHFSVALPEGWGVVLLGTHPDLPDNSRAWTYDIINRETEERMLHVLVYQGGPAFITSASGHISDFRFRAENGFQIWTRAAAGRRIDKVASKRFRTQASFLMSHPEANRLEVMLNSLRPAR